MGNSVTYNMLNNNLLKLTVEDSYYKPETFLQLI